jgi:hypothetical protein
MCLCIATEQLESCAFVVPGCGKFGIEPEGLIVSLDGLFIVMHPRPAFIASDGATIVVDAEPLVPCNPGPVQIDCGREGWPASVVTDLGLNK